MRKIEFQCLLAGLLLMSGCCRTCPRPSIVGVPPEGPDRRQFALPLSDADLEQVRAYLVGCPASPGVLCEETLRREHACVLEKLRGAVPGTSLASARLLAACTEYPDFTLEIRDSRGKQGDDFRGAPVADFVFVVYPTGVPGGAAGSPALAVFPDYVPVPAP